MAHAPVRRSEGNREADAPESERSRALVGPRQLEQLDGVAVIDLVPISVRDVERRSELLEKAANLALGQQETT